MLPIALLSYICTQWCHVLDISGSFVKKLYPFGWAYRHPTSSWSIGMLIQHRRTKLLSVCVGGGGCWMLKRMLNNKWYPKLQYHNTNHIKFVSSNFSLHRSAHCCCCRPTHPCLFGGVFLYFEVMGHPVPVPSLGFKCPDCFIWNWSYIIYPSQMKGYFWDNCLRFVYLWLACLMAGCNECIRRALVLGIVLIAGIAIEQAPPTHSFPI